MDLYDQLEPRRGGRLFVMWKSPFVDVVVGSVVMVMTSSIRVGRGEY